MKEVDLFSNKISVRKNLLHIRNTLSHERKQTAERNLSEKIWPFLQGKKNILSFFSLPNEINLSVMNHILLKEGRLILPTITQEDLFLFHIESWEQLSSNQFGLKQPDSDRCMQLTPECVDIAFIPGLGFDVEHYRIGYGKGHYDRLIPKLAAALKVGIAFQEQFCEGLLPREPHDQPVDKLLLF